MLLLEKLHAPRSACVSAGQGQAALPLGTITNGRESSAGGAKNTGIGKGQAPTPLHMPSAEDICRDTREKVISASCSQHQEAGVQPHEEPQDSSCAGASAHLHMETYSAQQREAQPLQRAESVVEAAQSQRREDAQHSISFLDDVDCLEVE